MVEPCVIILSNSCLDVTSILKRSRVTGKEKDPKPLTSGKPTSRSGIKDSGERTTERKKE